MKRYLLGLFLIVALVSCKSAGAGDEIKPDTPANPETPVKDTKKLFIYNSAWEEQTALEELYANKSAREITELTIEQYKEKYNLSCADDQLYLYDHAVDLANAPEATGYICNPMTNLPIKVYEHIPRESLVEQRETWRLQAFADGGVLYVDHIPAPIIDNRTDREKYSVYVINADGSIYAVLYCSEDPWASYGYTNLQQYYDQMCVLYKGFCDTQPGSGYTFQTGHYYTPPETTAG